MRDSLVSLVDFLELQLWICLASFCQWSWVQIWKRDFLVLLLVRMKPLLNYRCSACYCLDLAVLVSKVLLVLLRVVI